MSAILQLDELLSICSLAFIGRLRRIAAGEGGADGELGS